MSVARRFGSAAVRRIGSRCVAVLCGLGLAVALWVAGAPAWRAVRAHPYFGVQEVVVQGAGPALAAAEIRAWLGVPDGASLWDLVPARVRARLEAHPLIADAAVRREFPHRLHIAVRERRLQAIALLDAPYYLDRGGRVVQPLSAADSRDYPVITGLEADMPASYRAWAFRRALRLLRLCARRAWLGGVSEVHVDPRRGVVLYPIHPQVAVTLGWGSWRDKLGRASRVLRAWEGRTEHLAGLDLRYRNQVVVTLRAAARPAPGPSRVGQRI